MMKKKLITVTFIITAILLEAQKSEKDSLLEIINQHKGDTSEVNALSYLGIQQTDADSSHNYATLGLSLAEKINYQKGKADCYLVFSKINFQSGNTPLAIQNSLDALNTFKKINDYQGMATTYLSLQSICRDGLSDYRNSLNYAFSGVQVAEAHNVMTYLWYRGHKILPLLLGEMGQTYALMNMPDSALIYTQKSLDQNELFNGEEYEFAVYLMATIQNMQGKYDDALKNYRKALPLALHEEFPWDTLQIFSGMSTLFRNISQLDSSIHYAKIVATGWSNQSEYKNLLEALTNLTQIYKQKGNIDSAYKYLELSHAIQDSIYSIDNNREVQNVLFSENMKQQEMIANQAAYKNKVQLYMLLGGIFILLLIAIILWRNNQHKQIAKAKIEKAYTDLKATQSQLIQSEKMASLGELTAGSAHEIQNPLNFVNNFSEVNKDLLVELKDEIKKGNLDEVSAIADDVISNEEKINHHGKRADAIVKGMLQHSRSNSGVKEPTDINALADEYLRLAYHGLRAKDKSFNATMKTNFDDSLSADEAGIGNINIIPQDIGRVILNLITNAFYAVTEKKNQQPEYDPIVTVSTRLIKESVGSSSPIRHSPSVIISVKDNGNGIPQKVLDKIFQPFFTTKPTGQGTGLGLSLSYDIVKAHGGEIKVETKEGEGAEFIIQLPLNITS